MHVENQTVEQQLYEEFKKMNWWVRNESFEILFLLLYTSVFLFWLLGTDMNEFNKQYPGRPVVVICVFFIGAIVFVLVSEVLRHIFGKLLWRKYKKLHLPEDED
ncbi:MAG: hypothetical protein RIQ41_539, partial [Candidatus Parcubacteria bacterium]